MKTAGKRVLITGGGAGIGLSIANDRLEIGVGISRRLPLLSRIAPKAVFNVMNR